MAKQEDAEEDGLMIGFCAQPDDLSVERFADEAAVALPADRTARRDPSLREQAGVDERGKLGLEDTFAAPVEVSGDLHEDRLMRPNIIVLVLPPLEAALLGLEGNGWRAGGLIFKHAVHLLMRRIVLGMSRTAIHRLDTESQPPDGETR